MAEKAIHSLPRLFVSQTLGDCADILLEYQQTHYLRAVMRLKPGDRVRLFNGRHGEWLASIDKISKKTTVLKCISQLKEQVSPSDLWFLFAPIKQARLDYIAQKATEMGAGLIRPVKTDHTQMTRVKTDRLSANAIEAAEQCNLLSVPEIGSFLSLEEVLKSWPPQRGLIFCNETLEPGNPLDQIKGHAYNSYAVLVGPEGGFSRGEVKLLESKNFVIPISLGPRILRADTAGVAALAIVQAVVGDW